MHSYFPDAIVNNIENTIISSSTIHGYGLFALEYIRKNTILCLLDGQIMPWSRYHEIGEMLANQTGNLKDYFFMEWNALNKHTLLVRPLRTKYSYINHSRTPNTEILYNPIRVVATKDINPQDELTLDYRKEALPKEYLDGHGKTYL